jgi:hypothetical protein
MVGIFLAKSVKKILKIIFNSWRSFVTNKVEMKRD